MNDDNLRLPDTQKIINLEKTSQKEGSGILGKELIGKWNLKYVWGKDSNEINRISSSILQVLSARLEISEIDNENQIPKYEIKNSVKFGLISLQFKGEATLKGKRPLLMFFFMNLLLKVGNVQLFNKRLKKVAKDNRPFFALIANGVQNEWLCARGRGGGLAIWVKT